MKKGLLTAFVAVASLAVLPGVAAGQERGQDRVVGSGSTGFFTSFDLSATSGPFGESPTGHIAVDATGFGHFESSSITCMSVSGKAATIAGILEPNTFGFVGIVATVVDNGPAGSGGDSFTASPTIDAPTCPTPIPSTTGNLLSGDVVVVDAARRRGLGCGDLNHTHAEGASCGSSPAFAGLKDDSVVGTGDFGFFTNLDLDVRSGPLGENPTGHLAVSALITRFETSSISCLSVNGTAATIGGPLKPNSSGFVAVLASVSDNDLTIGRPDDFTASPMDSAPTVCPAPTPFSFNLGSGDIVVRDAGARRGLGCGDPNHTHLEDAEFCK